MKLPRIPGWVWLALIVTVIAVEVIAVANGDSGDTLSENVWFLVTGAAWLWLPLLVFFAALGVHFFFPGIERWFRGWIRSMYRRP